MAVDTQVITRLPPLESGDRLTQREFHRRYLAMPHIKKAELIEGVVYVASPVYLPHSSSHGLVMAWLGMYVLSTPGVFLEDNVTLILDGDNEVQPDAVLRIDATRGGRSQSTVERYLTGAPELIVEIAASSATRDLRDKLRAYRRNGVQEYMVWQVYDQRLDWFELRDQNYEPLEPEADGISRSRVFPGLWLNVQALLADDRVALLAAIQQGVASPEHAAFVARLTQP